jgi:hypothetical protein
MDDKGIVNHLSFCRRIMFRGTAVGKVGERSKGGAKSKRLIHMKYELSSVKKKNYVKLFTKIIV